VSCPAYGLHRQTKLHNRCAFGLTVTKRPSHPPSPPPSAQPSVSARPTSTISPTARPTPSPTTGCASLLLSGASAGYTEFLGGALTTLIVRLGEGGGGGGEGGGGEDTAYDDSWFARGYNAVVFSPPALQTAEGASDGLRVLASGNFDVYVCIFSFWRCCPRTLRSSWVVSVYLAPRCSP